MRGKLTQVARDTYEVFKHAGKEYGVDRVNRMSAAVAYRAIFAMAPLLILAVYLVGLVVGSEAARTEILEAIDRIAGETVYEAVETILDQLATTGAVTGLVGFVLLLWTASSLFLELQNDVNDIFDVPYEQTIGILETVRKRGVGFLLALSLGLVIILVLLINNIWSFLGGLFPASFEPVHRVVSLLTPVISLVLLPLVLGLFYQALSQVKAPWRAVWWGSFFSAVAILLTSYGASLYFRISGESAASLAGALFVILLLAYIYSAVFLFGAEVIRSYELHIEAGRPPDSVASGHKEAQPITSREDGN